MNFLGIFGVKTHWIIGQKSQNSARYGGAFLGKKSLFLGGWDLRRTPAAHFTSFCTNHCVPEDHRDLVNPIVREDPGMGHLCTWVTWIPGIAGVTGIPVVTGDGALCPLSSNGSLSP